jgi:hypothetical protein
MTHNANQEPFLPSHNLIANVEITGDDLYTALANEANTINT